jgi:hypothetical protein
MSVIIVGGIALDDARAKPNGISKLRTVAKKISGGDSTREYEWKYSCGWDDKARAVSNNYAGTYQKRYTTYCPQQNNGNGLEV